MTSLPARIAALSEFLAGYEAEHGVISEEEMREAARAARSRAVMVRDAPDPDEAPSRDARRDWPAG
ncbi:MAG TPA: hypothetical protein VGG35_17255 [Streptosporangiaceae bacterium]|jgi:hypothetical protein